MASLRLTFLLLIFSYSFFCSSSESRKELRDKEVDQENLIQLVSSVRSIRIDPSRVIQLSWQPRVFLYSAFLSDEECDHLISLADDAEENILETNVNSGNASTNKHIAMSTNKQIAMMTQLNTEDYKPKDVLHGIVREVTRPTKELLETINNLQEEGLEKMLYEHLLGKRYLVMVDDIWTMEAWDTLKRAFPEMDNGSKVMLTTRNRDVALNVDPRTTPYELHLLSKEESWELFLRKAFLDYTDVNCPQEFHDIGRRIVEKCDGLPLAIVVAGGLLSRKSLVSEWERFLNNINSDFAKGQHGVLAILSLSYIDLPSHLKSCFLHLSLFPEHFVISTRKLFQLWIAEGLIPRRQERMEVIAEEYLNELIDRNMVQVVRTTVNKRVKQCRIHDILRDLLIFKAKEEIFIEIHGKTDLQPSTKSRHHSVHSNFARYFASEPAIPRLRSLLLFHHFELCYPKPWMRISHLDFICANCKLLRVLDFENVFIGHLPKVIGKLIHLRYLCLKNSRLDKLPSTMRYLKSLQTLDLSGAVFLQEIPNAICKMENLRHLYMNASSCKGKLRIDTLKNLHTLSLVQINNLKLQTAGKLLNLRKLGVALDEDSDVSKFCNSIAELEQLESLQLVSAMPFKSLPSLQGLSEVHCLIKLCLQGRINTIPGPHEFPPNIAQLTLHTSFLSMNPMDVLKKLPKLSILRIRKQSYTGDQMAISAGGFRLLNFLELEGLDELQVLTIENGAMPRLRYLRISSCLELKELPVGIMSATTLQELEIIRMTIIFVRGRREKGANEPISFATRLYDKFMQRCKSTTCRKHSNIIQAFCSFNQINQPEREQKKERPIHITKPFLSRGE
ncbi:hypothetical protein Ddye_013751 [Dipteronia dyeriana]|uniref:NB-ARC domain-containing protein n=1 Tax=Dipteronia dyeriana TaxID=168575 RepID=A0AAD9X6S1_9ROSI|nr:hypothetical protein Ddye_013751 [Dipteronia dyeriana]